MSWTVADVMTKDVVAVGPDEDFKSVAKLINLHEVSALPVVDRDGRLVGIWICSASPAAPTCLNLHPQRRVDPPGAFQLSADER